MSHPLVSVVIPSYNHAAYVAETIGSVLTQSMTDLELLIIDDGSKDASPAIICRKLEEAGDSRARLIARENRGLCRTLNEGLVAARGRYFAYLGSDDLWEAEMLRMAISAIESAGAACGACYSDCYIIDETGARIGRFGAQYNYGAGDIYRDLVTMRYHPTSPTNLFVRQKLINAGGFNEAIPVEDRDTWLRVARYYRVAYVPRPLASWRIHERNTGRAFPERFTESNAQTFAWAIRTDPELRRFRRRIAGELQAGRAAAAYNELDFLRARREAVHALAIDPGNRVAWLVVVRSLLGRSVVSKLRTLRRQRSAPGHAARIPRSPTPQP